MKERQDEQEWQDVDPEWTEDDIGSLVLDNIAKSLYGPEEIVREYTQNAVDSYHKYEKASGGRTPENTVQLWVDADAGDLHILDRGLGMDERDIRESKKISISPKEDPGYRGFRGIGIWSALGACAELIVETTKLNCDRKFRMIVNCQGIVENMSSKTPILKLLRRKDVFRLERGAAPASEHYTLVRLVGVNRANYPGLLDEAYLREYASDALPVEFDPDWEHTARLLELLESVTGATTYNIMINGSPVYRKVPPVKVGRGKRQVDNIGAPVVTPITVGDRTAAVAWYVETRRPTAIGKVNSFTVRLKNLAIGQRGNFSENVEKLGLTWHAGEIYVIDDAVKPDTKRSSFEPTAAARAVAGAIEGFYREIAARRRAVSEQLTVLDAQHQVSKLADEIEALLDGDLYSPLSQTGRGLESLPDGAGDRDGLARSRLQDQAMRQFGDRWKDLLAMEQKLQESEREANRSARRNEALVTRLTREYLQRPAVQQAIGASLGRITVLRERAHSVPRAGEAAADIASELSGARSVAKTTARTATAQAERTNTESALFQTASTGLAETGSSRDRDMTSPTLVDLAVAQRAFLAAAATVINEKSEAYHRLVERLPAELERFGIRVT